MREIVLDTETTGLDPASGDRIVEIGAIELHNHVATGQTYHQYINPERAMPAGAFAVHGLGDDFLRDKPVFATIAAAFLEFVADSKLVIHNAAFDMRFLNAELARLDMAEIATERAIDTLEIARRKYPGAGNSLDALCRRFGVSNAARDMHGALLDSELLAEVYLELIGGRQPDFGLGDAPGQGAGGQASGPVAGPQARPRPLASRLSEDEARAHARFVAGLGKSGKKTLWPD